MRNSVLLSVVVVVVLSAVPAIFGAGLECINQGVDGPSATNFATCPEGYTVTGCSCGHACGSYSIQELDDGRTRCFCHYGCPNGNPIDWTLARCCKVHIHTHCRSTVCEYTTEHDDEHDDEH
ncbi:resistin-like isoform X1 [Ptychodera flava]|uniref:resistin-like isoform X1 n=1 Tax=Ptychodera flava TaxID=63121 RepID=UPI00396A3329